MKIEILDEAQEDLVEGCHFYERQLEGVGDYFLDSLFSDIDSLQLACRINLFLTPDLAFIRALAPEFKVSATAHLVRHYPGAGCSVPDYLVV